MYGRCGRVEEARCVFAKIPAPNLYSWTMIVTAYAQNGHPHEALGLLRRMDLDGTPPDKVVLSIAVTACASICALSLGKQIHHRVATLGVIDDFLRSSLINLYGTCGEISLAKSVFDSMAAGATNLVCWATMIKAFARCGQFLAGIELFWEWISRGVEPDAVTLVSAVDCCAGLGDLQQSQAIHARVLAAAGMESNEIKVSNAILDMYARCGSVDDARALFDRMASRTNISWTSMVAAYAQNGHPSLALEISREMDQVGMSKNAITFITILSACNHGGLLEEGIRFLAGMRRDHGVLPSNAHYSCVIDLLGKAGRLEEAESMIAGLVERPDAGLWRSLLGSCRIHGDEERAGRAGEELKKLEPSDAAPYVVKKLFLLET
ncbi:hypothetical protein SELMODRAFT_96526 [Selaginella moellendorffii]|uniref:Pentacotripeptide-repeat region of PRORP domain-containing protein n=1 Tax=Selaginella moellendorffii TaxID=88036 RepID=D8RLP5_SELML|nr:hypothetical protein SELMODRAFT_96526 [Selaginella moellendorffii]